jgi:hemoglobin-like flavoprotein
MAKLQNLSKGGWGFWNRGSKDNGKEQHGQNAVQRNANGEKQFEVPQTFEEMCTYNANMTGIDLEMVKIVQDCFQGLIVAVARGDDTRLELEANVMAIRFHKDVKTKIVPTQFQTVMLASLRSLLPKLWSIAHENAWVTMWEMVSGFLLENMGLAAKYEKAIDLLMQEMVDDEHKDFGIGAFNRLFEKQPKAETYFKASNARLNFLAGKSLNLATQMYKDPTNTMKETMGLGLRHIMYNVDTGFFADFVTALVEELKCHTNDEVAIEGVEYTLTLIATTMVNTINEGQNPLLRAIAVNSASGVKKALGGMGRQTRAGGYL